MGIFFTGDTHFHHTNILKYCPSRQKKWTSIAYMNAGIVKNWNSVVLPKDTVYFLGDFAFADKNQVQDLLNQLNGKIILITGNHDRKPIRDLFSDCYEQVVIKIGHHKIALVHRPEDIINSNDIDFGLCGHVHQWFEYFNEFVYYGRFERGEKKEREIPFPVINVGIDNPMWDFTPCTIDQVLNLFQRIKHEKRTDSKNA